MMICFTQGGKAKRERERETERGEKNTPLNIFFRKKQNKNKFFGEVELRG